MRRRQQAVLEHAERDILHVGCVGEYTWLDKLDHDIWIHGALVDRYGHDAVVGIDVYEPGIEAARADGYDVRQADAETFDLVRQFDTIVAAQMLHHLANPGLALERFADHLRPGGRVVLAHPNHFYVERQLHYGIEARHNRSRRDRDEKPDDHTNHTASHRPGHLLELFERAGYTLEAGYYVPSGSRPSSAVGWCWHRAVLPALDAVLPDLFTKKTYIAVFKL